MFGFLVAVSPGEAEAALLYPDISVVFLQFLNRPELSIGPAAFDELEDEDSEAVPPGPEGKAEGGGSFPFSLSGMYDDKSFFCF